MEVTAARLFPPWITNYIAENVPSVPPLDWNADARSPESGSVVGVQIRQFALRKLQLNAADGRPTRSCEESSGDQATTNAGQLLWADRSSQKEDLRGTDRMFHGGVRVTCEYPKGQVTSAVYLAKGYLHPNR